MIFRSRDPGEVQLNKWHLFAYGWLNVPMSIAGLPLAIYIPAFYAIELGLSTATIGWILFLARISDIITDPMIGVLSDRTPERWGRRRLWMIIGIPLLAYTTYMVYSPPAHVGFLYTFIWISLLYIAWTIVTIPYTAWAAELSLDYKVRTLITGWRETLGTFGQLLVMVLPFALPWLAEHGVHALEATRGESMGPLLHIVAVVTAISLFLSLGLLLWILPEIRVPTSELNWASGLRVIWRNGPFKRLMLVNIFNNMGWTVVGTLFIYYVRYILQAGLAASGWLLLIYYTAGIIGAPLCVKGGNLLGKHRMYAWTIIVTCAVYLPSALLGKGDELWFALILSVTGLTITAGGILGSSMSADVIDIDTLRSGQQRGALFMALWAIASKFGAMFGALIALNLLELMGFKATLHGGVTGSNSLLFLYIVLPIVFWLISAVFIWHYPITEARHAKIRARVERKMNQLGRPSGAVPSVAN